MKYFLSILFLLIIVNVGFTAGLPWGGDWNDPPSYDDDCDILMSSVSAQKGSEIYLPIWMLETTADKGGFDVSWNIDFLRVMNVSSSYCTVKVVTKTDKGVPKKYRFVCDNLNAKEKTSNIATIKFRTQQNKGTTNVIVNRPTYDFYECALLSGKVTVK